MSKFKVKTWVDGSFSIIDKNGIYGGAAVTYIGDDKTPLECKWADHQNNMGRLRNVAGELLAVMGITQKLLPLKDNIESTIIFYDYDGIAKWATGEWQARKDVTQAYVKYIRPVMESLHIEFVHVKGHSGNVNNERADRLAKEAVKEHASNIQRILNEGH